MYYTDAYVNALTLHTIFTAYATQQPRFKRNKTKRNIFSFAGGEFPANEMRKPNTYYKIR